MKNWKRFLKIGDVKYSMSLQKFCSSYKIGFPQRDEYFMQNTNEKGEIFYYHHGILDKSSLNSEKNKFLSYLEKNSASFDGMIIDNPLSFLILPEVINKPLIFDMIDWYEEMYNVEWGNGDEGENDGDGNLLASSLRQLMRVIDGLIVQSPLMLEYARSIGFNWEKKNIVIPNGYDHKIFYTFSAERINEIKDSMAEKYHVDLTDKIIVVYQGKLGKWYKDLEYAIKDINGDEKIVAFIVGDGPLKDRLCGLATGNIVFTGSVPLTSVSQFTNIADVCIFPVNDCSPIAISEYLGVGKPIVVRKGRINWLLKDGQNCYSADGNNLWKENIYKAWENSEKLSANNMKLAKRLSWKALARSYIEFLVNVTG